MKKLTKGLLITGGIVAITGLIAHLYNKEMDDFDKAFSDLDDDENTDEEQENPFEDEAMSDKEIFPEEHDFSENTKDRYQSWKQRKKE